MENLDYGYQEGFYTRLRLLFVFFLSAILLGGFSPICSADPTLPPGFEISLVAENLQGPTAIESSPDGRIFVSQKSGQLRVVKNGYLLEQPFLTVDVDTAGEHGLMGIAFDPKFSENAYVYIYYVAKTPNIHARVSRFTAQGDVAVPGSEKVLIDLDDRGSSIFHVAGSVHFGLDGKLYISSGDDAGWPLTNNAQLFTTTFGKILRINSDGSIPTDNPFISKTKGIYQSIWSTGFRNPFTFSIQPGTGRTFVNDVGQDKWEDIKEAKAGDTFGWPTVEGMGTDPQFKNPIYAYDHGTDWEGGCSIVGGTFYNPIMPQFPDQYVGKYFFIDYCKNWIHIFDPATGVVSPFAENATSSPVILTLGQDGSLYFASEWFNSLYKVSFSGSQAPQILTQPQDQLVGVGTSVTFSLEIAGATPLSYQWQKNDANIPNETAATLTLPNIQLSDSGAHYRCVVTNSYGSTTSHETALTVVNASPPAVSINAPLVGTHYNAGDTISFSGSATDGSTNSGGQLPPSAFTWEVHFQHNTHFHPFVPPTSGITSGTFVIPTQGEPSDNTWYRIFLTVTNSAGLSTTLTREIFPNKSTFTLNTVPPGLPLNLDGQPVSTPDAVVGVIGFIRTLGVDSPLNIGSHSYEFVSWSDGGAATHTFATSASPETYTATFKEIPSTRNGSIVATPNPILVCSGSTGGSTTLQWTSSGTTNVEVHIGGPNGNLLASSASGNGSYTTPNWVGNGSTFYLQDVSGGLPLNSDNTLASVQVNLTSIDCGSR